MKIALYALSRRGVELAVKLQKLAWPGVEMEIFAHEKWFIPDHNVHWHKLRFKESLSHIFPKYDAHICIMALGIVIRELTPLLRHKTVDPAVVVVDELGRFAISVLSGHLGGANGLAETLAERIGAQAVITTASDGLRRLTPDSYSQLRGWKLEYPQGLIAVNSAIVNDQKCYLYVDRDLTVTTLPWGEHYPIHHGGKTLDVSAVYPLEQWPGPKPAIIFSAKQISGDLSETVVVRPRNLIVGVGCKRGTSKEEIINAIDCVFRDFGLSISSILCLGSIDLKADEIGLIQAAQELQTELIFVDRTTINESDLIYTHSDFVKKTVGVGGVCEPVAMILAGRTGLLVPRQAQRGITIAIAQKRINL